MDNDIELALESPDGIIDCRLEPFREEGELFYSATILYPQIVNGYSRSHAYCHTLRPDPETGDYHFSDETVHPKVRKLEGRLSHAIVNAK